jgi:MurNAc alpha-1-phosphate uridylyltransferase
VNGAGADGGAGRGADDRGDIGAAGGGGPSAGMALAAGFGTRMRPLTDATPKALLRAGGRTLLDRAIDRMAEAGARRVVVNLHHLAAQVRAHLATRAAPEILFSEEFPDILETGGGLRRALPLLGPAPFFALNADAVWTGASPTRALAAAWRPAAMDALLLLVPRDRAAAYTRPGDFAIDPDGRPRRRTGDTAPLVYTGAQIVSPAAFADAPDGAFSMNLVWDRLAARGRLFAAVHDGGWIDVGTPAGLDAADAALAAEAGRP